MFTMKFRRKTGSNAMRLVLVLGILCSILTACNPGGSANRAEAAVIDNANEFEVIRAAADKFLSEGGADKQTMSKDLHTLINDDDPGNDPRVIDTRNNNTWMFGHICGSVSTPWHQVFLTMTPGKFDDTYFYDNSVGPTNKQIVIVSYTGQEGGGLTLAALNMLGWDAVKIKWGYNQWQFCPQASPGAFFPATAGNGQVTGLNTSGVAVQGFWGIGQKYPTDTTPNTATQTHDFPVVNNTGSTDRFEIIRAAANKLAQKETPLTSDELAQGGSEQRHTWWPTDIIPEDLFNSLNDPVPPFIISIQPRELYDKGHIKGMVWFDIKTICQPENLKLLPTDRQIVVVSNDGQSGSTVSAILNILGYDSYNLLFGMMAWTESDEIVTKRFQVYEADMRTFKDVLDYKACWIDIPQYDYKFHTNLAYLTPKSIDMSKYFQ
jgi:rhodanese-related sulfurtransferase